MIALYVALLVGLVWRHLLTPPAAGAFALLGFAVWLFIKATEVVL